MRRFPHFLLLLLTLLQSLPLRACEIGRWLTGVNSCTGASSCDASDPSQDSPETDEVASVVPPSDHLATCTAPRPSLPRERSTQSFAPTLIDLSVVAPIAPPASDALFDLCALRTPCDPAGSSFILPLRF